MTSRWHHQNYLLAPLHISYRVCERAGRTAPLPSSATIRSHSSWSVPIGGGAKDHRQDSTWSSRRAAPSRFSIGHDHIHFFSSVCCRAISKFLIVLSFWLPVAEELPSCRRHFRIVLHVIERTAILCFSPFFTTSYAHCNRMTACRKTWTFHKLTQMPGLITSKLWTFWISNAQLQSMRSNQAPEEAADWPPKPPIYTYIHSKSKSEFSY